MVRANFAGQVGLGEGNPTRSVRPRDDGFYTIVCSEIRK